MTSGQPIGKRAKGQGHHRLPKAILLPVHPICRSDYLKFFPVNQEAHDLTSLHQVKGAEHVAQYSHIQHKIEKGAASKDRQR